MRVLLLPALLLAVAPACSSKESTTNAGPGGGPVSGPSDTHCTAPTKKVVTVDPAACTPDAGPPMDASSDAEADGGSDDAMTEESAPTMYGAKGDDDDCKYHMEWSITATHKDEDATVTFTLTKIADGKPATGAAPSLEIFLDETHLASKLGDKAVEVSPGTYQIKGVRFDASGKWTLRFHVYADCADGESSPHGHGAFYVSVP